MSDPTTRATAAAGYFATVRSMTTDPELLAAVDRAEAATAALPTCPQCLHSRHGRRVCRDANCCSCRLTWRDAWKAGYMQGWRDYPSALWRGFYPPTEVDMESTVAAEGYIDTYPVDNNGWAAVSRPFARVRADQVERGDLLILPSGLSRATGVMHYRLDNGVTVVHITGPTNIVRATHEMVTVLRNGT